MRFFIQGTPKPQARPRAVRRGRHAAVYSETTEWKEGCKFQVAQLDAPSFCTAIEVNLYFWFHRPNDHYGTGRNSGKLKPSAPKYHIKKPDKDNLEKAVTDALVDAGLLSDDSIIVRGMTSKSYITKEEKSGCWVEINQL